MCITILELLINRSEIVAVKKRIKPIIMGSVSVKKVLNQFREVLLQFKDVTPLKRYFINQKKCYIYSKKIYANSKNVPLI